VAAGLGRSRRAQAAVLVACLTVLFVEAGIHSVHHVSDPPAAAKCPFFATSQHLTAGDIEVTDLGVPAQTHQEVVPVTAHRVATQRHLGPVQGRAPPAAPLA
jgi:hypothetical protein